MGGLNGYRYTLNPTGWVDPLGLVDCPGKGGCRPAVGDQDPAGKVGVYDGTTTLPKVNGPKTEQEAKRQVMEWNRKYRMHSVEKHSPEISDVALKQRSIDGSHPTKKGVRGPIGPSSQFKSWVLHYRALSHAFSKMHRDVPEPTGYDADGNPYVRMELPGAGRGYKPNKNDPGNPRYVENLDGAEVKFDKKNVKRPFTGFPR